MPLATFESRLPPLQDTFLDTEETRPRVITRQRSFPGFVPHWMGLLDLDDDIDYRRKFQESSSKSFESLEARVRVPEITSCAPTNMSTIAGPVLLGRTRNSGNIQKDWLGADASYQKCMWSGASGECAYGGVSIPSLSPEYGREQWSIIVDEQYSQWTEQALSPIPNTSQRETPQACHIAAPPINVQPSADDSFTTLMIRNLPVDIVQSDLIDELNACGFRGLFDFCYMPSSFDSKKGVNVSKGYAFINFISSAVARELVTVWHLTLRFGMLSPSLALNISAAAVQGLEDNTAKWNSPRLRRIQNPNSRPFLAGEA